MNEIALIILVIQQWIEYATLGLENLLGLPRTEADRPQTCHAEIQRTNVLLIHGAVLNEPAVHPVIKVELLDDEVEADAVHGKFESTHLAAEGVDWAYSLASLRVRL